VIPSTLQGETSPDVGGGANGTAAKPAPAKRESIASISDVSKVTDPRLVIRRGRMRRVFTGVMAGAVGILALAGVCALVRRPDAAPVSTTANVAETSAPATAAPAPPAEPAAPAPAEPAPQPEAAETQAPLASAAASKTPLPRTHRPKAAPHKARNAAVGAR
jgi:hypothetical protein